MYLVRTEEDANKYWNWVPILLGSSSRNIHTSLRSFFGSYSKSHDNGFRYGFQKKIRSYSLHFASNYNFVSSVSWGLGKIKLIFFKKLAQNYKCLVSRVMENSIDLPFSQSIKFINVLEGWSLMKKTCATNLVLIVWEDLYKTCVFVIYHKNF